MCLFCGLLFVSLQCRISTRPLMMVCHLSPQGHSFPGSTLLQLYQISVIFTCWHFREASGLLHKLFHSLDIIFLFSHPVCLYNKTMMNWRNYSITKRLSFIVVVSSHIKFFLNYEGQGSYVFTVISPALVSIFVLNKWMKEEL